MQRKIEAVNAAPIPSPQSRFISFVPAGHKPIPSTFGILFDARDWICDFYLPEFHPNGGRYCIPCDIGITDLRCDGYLVSRSMKICVVFELTVPMEDNIEYWHQKKLEKYADVFSDTSGWTSFCCPKFATSLPLRKTDVFRMQYNFLLGNVAM